MLVTIPFWDILGVGFVMGIAATFVGMHFYARWRIDDRF